MKPITPSLVRNQAEEAARYYCSVSRIRRWARSPTTPFVIAGVGSAEGSVMTVEFQLNGQDFLALTVPGVQVHAGDLVHRGSARTRKSSIRSGQLTSGGKEVQCGWLEDKFGVSWQIVPEMMDDWLDDKEPGSHRACHGGPDEDGQLTSRLSSRPTTTRRRFRADLPRNLTC